MKTSDIVAYMNEKDLIVKENRFKASKTRHYNSQTIRTLRMIANAKTERRVEL